MTKHAVVIAGGGPTGLMLAGELALARVDVAIVERRENQDLAGARAGGLHSRTIEVLDQRGIAERFLSQGKIMQVATVTWRGSERARTAASAMPSLRGLARPTSAKEFRARSPAASSAS
jgi:2-polyprenyl-6-methoxyphenol hydroxylase-like FAD-dependent oxidoreductase